MENITSSAEAQSLQMIKQMINFWLAQNKAINDFYAKHDHDVYLREVAPGRNNGVYLLAHLIATNDGILPLMGLGEKLFPELSILANEPESAFPHKLSLEQLKVQWERLNLELEAKFRTMSVSQWLERHTAVSEEDFQLDPSRNKLNILITRSSHQNYHRGQLVFLNEKLQAA